LLKRVGNKIIPTNAFMLLTDNPIREARVQCALFKGTDSVVFIDRREFDGPLYEQIEEAQQFVLKHINLGVKIVGIGSKHIYELPVESIREMIVNAVTHRNYAESTAIRVAIYSNRVEVTSPGILFGGLTMNDVLNGASRIRNKAIATVFAQMHIIDDWGTGIRRIMNECQEYGLPAPEFTQAGPDFRVKMFRPLSGEAPGLNDAKDTHSFTPSNEGVNEGVIEGLNKSESAILMAIVANNKITTNNLVVVVGKSVSTVERALSSLKRKGLLSRVGSDKTGHWEVVTNGKPED